MKRAIESTKIGFFSMLFLCLNGIIGSGLFLLPGRVDFLVGKWALVLYAAVALIVMSIGWCYAKCATHFSENGGVYLYAKEAFGDCIGFQVGFVKWVVSMIAQASLTAGFIVALSTLFPSVMMAPFKQLITIAIILGLAVFNLFGINAIKKLNNGVTLVKAALLLAFLGFGIWAIQPGELHFSHVSLPKASLFGSAGLIIFYAFSGFEALPVVAAETVNPKKNVPRAMLTAIVLSSLLYFVIQAISIGTLGEALSQSASPMTDIAHLLFGDVGELLLAITMLITIGGVIVASSFVTPRSGSALAADHPLFALLKEENQHQVPYNAVIVSSVIACAIALSGTFVELITISVVSRFVQHTTTCFALFSFEKKGIMKPFSTPLHRLIPLFALSSMGWLLFFAEPYQIFWGLFALMLGLPLYGLQKYLFKPALLPSR